MIRIRSFFFAASAALSLPLSAQWVTETYSLDPGWNAIYLHIDPSHEPLDALIDRISPGSNGIQEIWEWNPSQTTAQFTTDPSDPTLQPNEWLRYSSAEDIDQIGALKGNTAYLIRSNDLFLLELTGRPVVPSLTWNNNGLNLHGFSTPEGTTAKLDALFSGAPELILTRDVFKYQGEDLATNPVPVLALRNETATRGTAFWFNTEVYSRYVGPISVRAANGEAGLDYGPDGAIRTLTITNHTDEDTVVTLAVDSSMPTPAEALPGFPANAGPLNLALQTLVQGETTPDYTLLFVGESPSIDINLAANSTVELRLAADRGSMFGEVGAVFASILTVTDAANLMQIRIGARAEVGSRAGLYIGQADLNQVSSTFHEFARDDEGATQFDEDGQPIYLNANGEPVGTTPPLLSEDFHPAADSFPLRVLLHIDESGEARLLSTVFIGRLDDGIAGEATLPVGLTTVESALDPDTLNSASRLTAGHLPPGETFLCTGSISSGRFLTQVALAYDAPTNPFVHTYHPDHDNLDARFETALNDGDESYSVVRLITLDLDSAILGLGTPGTVLEGLWTERVSGLNSVGEQKAAGPFVLQRVAALPTILTTAP